MLKVLLFATLTSNMLLAYPENYEDLLDAADEQADPDYDAEDDQEIEGEDEDEDEEEEETN